jgi:hypothetical protein
MSSRTTKVATTIKTTENRHVNQVGQSQRAPGNEASPNRPSGHNQAAGNILSLGRLQREQSSLRGFAHLYLLAMGLYALTLAAGNWRSFHTIFDPTNFLWTFGFGTTRRWWECLGVHLAMPAFITSIMLAANWTPLAITTARILALDTALISTCLVGSWTMRYRLFHSLLFSLQALTLIMKMHSFLDYRRHHSALKASFSYLVWYMCTPVVIYAPDYQRRRDPMKWRHILDHLVLIALGWFLVHLVLEQRIVPQLRVIQHRAVGEGIWTGKFVGQFLDSWLHLMLPSLLCGVALFWTFFEHVLTIFALLTNYGEPCVFYGDWWNSRTFADFARSWNLPVHQFLRQHFYQPFVNPKHEDPRQTSNRPDPDQKQKRQVAVLMTFLVSSAVHELMLQVALQRWTWPFLFAFQMSQLPLTSIVKWLFPHDSPKRLNGNSGAVSVHRASVYMNALFWAKMIIGPPLILLLYATACSGVHHPRN